MKNLYLLLTTLFLGNVYAGPVEQSTVEEKRKRIKDLTHTIIAGKAQLETTAKSLKEQRDGLKQKIGAARKEFAHNTVALKGSANKAVDELHTSLKKLKDSATVIDETRDAATATTQAAAEEASLNQAIGTLDTIELPKDISD